MHRVLAVIIALLLGGAAVAALVKGGNEGKPVVVSTGTPAPSASSPLGGQASESPSESPSESFTPATEEPTEGPTVSPTESMTELPRTGGGSFAPAALVTLGIALAGGLTMRRAVRSFP